MLQVQLQLQRPRRSCLEFFQKNLNDFITSKVKSYSSNFAGLEALVSRISTAGTFWNRIGGLWRFGYECASDASPGLSCQQKQKQLVQVIRPKGYRRMQRARSRQIKRKFAKLAFDVIQSISPAGSSHKGRGWITLLYYIILCSASKTIL